MTITPAQMRADFTEFADNVKFPDAMITFWANIADKMINNQNLDTMMDTVKELFIAHNCVLEADSLSEVAFGNLPGMGKGPISSQSADKLSESYTADAFEKDAGHWNLTTYGTRYIRTIRLFGAGGMVSC